MRRRRDLLDHLSDIAVAGSALVERQVGLSDDAHATSAVIHHRDAADLSFRHDLLHGFDRVIGTAALRVARHRLSDQRLWTLALSGAATGDIPVTHQTNDSICLHGFHYMYASPRGFPHRVRRLVDRLGLPGAIGVL